ncbi:MAG: hypothetical protein JO130_00785, partial [Solirubrobacterales bacterium]|nr:hypothetical protein [Solirubrobacterales bacterium]
MSTAAPVILDPDVAPIEQSVLPASNGTWSGSPTAYSYQWQRCTELDRECLDIVGATGPRYTLTAADVKHNVQL